ALPSAPSHGTFRLAPYPTLVPSFARPARYFRRKPVQLVHHRVDGALQLEDLPLHVHRDLLGEVPLRDRRGHLGDISHLAGEVRRHRVDVVGEVLPGAGHTRHLRLASELSVGTHLARHPRYLGGEAAELIHHGVDDFSDAQKLAAQRPPVDLVRHALRQVALGDRLDDAWDLETGPNEVPDQRVDGVDAIGPRSGGRGEPDALVDLPFAADVVADAREFLGHLLVRFDDVVEYLRDLSVDPGEVHRKANRKIS